MIDEHLRRQRIDPVSDGIQATGAQGGFACCAFAILDSLTPQTSQAAESDADREKEFVRQHIGKLVAGHKPGLK